MLRVVLLLSFFANIVGCYGDVQKMKKQALETPSEQLKAAGWKNRVLLVSQPELQPLWAAALKREKAALLERDLIVIEADATLRKRYRLNDGQFAVVLIGKDGGRKAVQRDKPNLPAFFAKIDRMPMRQREMRERKLPEKRAQD